MINGFRALVLALALMVCPAGAAVAADPLPANTIVSPDPAIKFGTLPNGLRYAIARNGAPPGAVSIRLAVRAGSYDEEDGELGYAHFIEHLTFRSTKQAPNGILDNRFANVGVTLGRDQNAMTGLSSTIYIVDLPTNDLAAVRTILDWMRGAADGILFTPAAIDLERGVVMAEIQARDSPVAEVQQEMARFFGPDLRSPERNPGGTPESLKAATPAKLQRFYERWYRPDNAMLVVIGDVPVEELEEAATDAFAGWQAKGPPPVRATPNKAADRALDTFVRSGPALPTAVSACRVAAPDTDSLPVPEKLRREVYSAIWTGIVNARLAHSAAAGGAPILGAGTSVSRDVPDNRSACLFVMPSGENWEGALAVGQKELRRFGKDGPTAQELAKTVEQLRSRINGAVYTSQTRVSALLANEIAEAEMKGLPFAHPREALRLYNLAVAGLTADDVRKAFLHDWSGSGPLIAATAPAAPAREALASAWAKGEAAPLEAYADTKRAEWVYWNFGKAGTVKSREQLEHFVRLRFDNGLMMNFKQTPSESGAVDIRVRFGHGELGLDKRSRLPAQLAAGFFPMGGLGKMSFEEIGSALENTTWNFNLDVDATGFVLGTSTLTDQVDQQMRLLAAYMTDPGFRPLIDEKLPGAVDLIYRGYRANPNAVAAEALEKALFPDNLSLPPREQIAAFRVKDFEGILRGPLTRSPIEVTVVGDIREASAIRAVASTFGALPARKPDPRPAKGPFRYFPETIPPPVTAAHEGPADKAAALLMWPTYVASYERRREEYAIGLLSSIFQTRLIQQVRGVMGKVYSPAVGNVMIDEADQGYIAASIESSASDLDPLIATALQISDELASGKISQQEVEEARGPLVAARQQAHNQNAAWAGVISHTIRNPEAIEELVKFERDMAVLTLDDVRKAGAAWLKRRPMIAKALPPAARR
jgi:zinc protease